MGNCSRLSPNAVPPPASGSPTPAADSVSTLGVWGGKPWDGAGVTQAQGRALGTDKVTRKKLFFITTCPRFWGQSLRVMPGPGNRKKKSRCFPPRDCAKGSGAGWVSQNTLRFFGVKAACEGLFWAVSTQKQPKHFLRAEAADSPEPLSCSTRVWSQEQLLSLVPVVPSPLGFGHKAGEAKGLLEDLLCQG